MKRILSVIFVLIIAMGVAFAVNPISALGAKVEQSSFESGLPQVTVTLNLSSKVTEHNYLEVGFASQEVDTFSTTSEKENLVSFIPLKINDDKATASIKDGLFIYCKHRGNNRVVVKLTADETMSDTAPDPMHTLGWKVDLGTEPAQNVVNTTTTTESATVYPATVYSDQTGNWVSGKVVSYPITIETANFADKPAVDYSGNLTVTVTVS